MAGKKQRRMEQSPDERDKTSFRHTDKPDPDLIKVKITLTGNEQRRSERMQENIAAKAEKIMQDYAKNIGAGFLFGGGPRDTGQMRSSGGGIFVEGGDGAMREAGQGSKRGAWSDYIDAMKRDPDISRMLSGMLREGGEGVDFKSAVASMLHRHAIEVWDDLINWQFAVTYNHGMKTFWFTARYYDTEEQDNSLPLVSETLEFAEETLARRNWDETNLEVERQMVKMHDKCLAELAMFE